LDQPANQGELFTRKNAPLHSKFMTPGGAKSLTRSAWCLRGR
jgi:hypothetical protein